MSAVELMVEEAREGVALVRIDRPPANALTLDLRERIRATWELLRDDDSVRAVVVTASGDRFFSAGLDLGEVASWRGDPDAMHERIDRRRWDPEAVGLWKPVIGAINGYCLAAGWALAEMCDVRIAAEHAEFGIPEGRWGLPAIFVRTLGERLPQNVALEAAMWAGRRFSSQRLYELGWLNAVVPYAELDRTALDWAEEVAALPPAAVEAHKRLVRGSPSRERAEEVVRPLYDVDGVAANVGEVVSR